MRNREYILKVAKELEKFGVDRYTIDRGHKHPRVVFTLNGQPRFVVIPGSPSDHRSIKNSTSQIRRMMDDWGIVAVA